MTNYPSAGRNHRPRGFHVKRAFQLALFLAVCIWLLYKMTHPNNKTDYARRVQTKLSEGQNTIILGRKGNAAEGEHRDGGGEGETGEQDSLHKGIEYVRGYVKTHEKNESRKSKNNFEMEVGEMGKEVLSTSDLVMEGDNRNSEREFNEQQKEEEISIHAVIPGDDRTTSSNKESDGDKDVTKGKEMTLQPTETEKTNGTLVGQSEMPNGVHGFHDQNGVPQDERGLVEFTLT